VKLVFTMWYLGLVDPFSCLFAINRDGDTSWVQVFALVMLSHC